MRDLRSVLVSHGVDMTGWTLIQAYAVSNDGRVIVGWGFGPDGHDEAFYARLDEPMGLPSLGFAGLLALVGMLASAGLLVSRKPA